MSSGATHSVAFTPPCAPVRFGTITGNVPWLTAYLGLLPAPDNFQKIFRFAKTQLDWRRSQPNAQKHDIFHYLVRGESRLPAPALTIADVRAAKMGTSRRRNPNCSRTRRCSW